MTETKAGLPVTIGDLVIEPIERTVVCVERIDAAIVVVARKEPVSVVIRTPAGTWTVDLESFAPVDAVSAPAVPERS